MAQSAKTRSTASSIRSKIERGGERLWRHEDFREQPFPAVAQTLSRLTRNGTLQRLSKGIYYRSRPTPFGPSRPNPRAIQKLAEQNKAIFPTGIAAANLLGFSTQIPKRSEVATNSLSLPKKLIGTETKVHSRRPEAWKNLSQQDAALLDFLRKRGKSSELSPEQTTQKTLALLKTDRLLERLLKVADSEPPRVRALLGAFAEELGQHPGAQRRLRTSLNPLSRFDFGYFASLKHARKWQAKELSQRETL
ncbi:DUF6088 family protein [Granulicella sp. L46]|uniref:DUF6088 family protein n=1 Tax=Granulicella sp. L46 TaxID=1641865 RepID=UPI00131AD80C|nr:DUF6088 family protein [Granulicella sp. L46]